MNNKEIEPYIQTVDNWKWWKMIFIIPIFIFSLTMLPTAFINLAEQASLKSNGWNITSLEYSLIIPTSLLLFLLVLLANRNKIKSILFNNIILSFSYGIFYYQIIIAFQFFIKYPLLRILNWLFFTISIFIIIYSYSNKKFDLFNFFSKKKTEQIVKIVAILWGINLVASSLFEGLKDLKNLFWSSIVSFMPLILIILSIGVYDYGFKTIHFLKKINQNQETYRTQYGYSKKDWYGSKSKEYKEELKKSNV
ncbi:hypothetical protein [Enterococcus rivorum]|uniref:Uncharacterized protein n=1 Tax=Enterococcus rivorum TaxID=762845 RepID=A0A1E5KUR8_9ENTE|nr:hypothetical protein [Enterococcus rivorum]MBP2099090.1 hypothetical protein [Enterococcus rivorum]OEH81657.1 hypothetical protein BCR26_15945 [Enterococcus rivorum]